MSILTKDGKALLVSGKPIAVDGSSSLPIATANTLGGIKVGSGLSVTADGTLSSAGGGNKYLHTFRAVFYDRDVWGVQIITDSSTEMTITDVAQWLYNKAFTGANAKGAVYPCWGYVTSPSNTECIAVSSGNGTSVSIFHAYGSGSSSCDASSSYYVFTDIVTAI